MKLMHALLFVRVILPSAATAAAAAWRSFPIFHLNPRHEGALPVNMDTADLRGDILFDLTARTVPLACHDGTSSTMSHHDCTNAETTDPDVVVSKLTLHTRGAYGEYAACNICPSSGIDDYSHLECQPDAYICTCRVGNSTSWPWRLERCENQTSVGRQEVSTYFASWPQCSWETWVRAPYACWWRPVVNLTGGVWYSTTAGGWCDAPHADPETCTWRATVDKVVNKSCSDNVVHGAVETYDASHAGCFSRCGAGSTGPQRNTTSPCWVYCLFATLIGPQAMLPGGGFDPATATDDTMPIGRLEDAFAKVFAPEHEGGCPALERGEVVES